MWVSFLAKNMPFNNRIRLVMPAFMASLGINLSAEPMRRIRSNKF